MGLFSGPWLSKEEHERSVHLNLISRVNSLELINLELTGKLQVAQGRVDELHNQAAMNGRLLTENAELRERIAELEHDCEMRRATNIGQAQTLDGYANRIKELETALVDAIEELRYAYMMGFSERYRDAARAAQKALGKGEWDNLTAHPFTDAQRQLDERSESNRHTDLIERLREHAENMYVDFLNDAADALEAQAKRIAELEAALKPFADKALAITDLPDNWQASVSVGEFRAARKALEKGDE